MRLHQGSRSRGREAAVRGQVEVLEGRTLLSCTVSEAAGTLTVRGTRLADVIQVRDGGGIGPGQIHVRCDNGVNGALVDVARSQGPITNVVIIADRGDDNVLYKLDILPPEVFEAPRTVNINAGNGNDLVNVVASGVSIEADLTVLVDGGRDNDTINLAAVAVADPVTGLPLPTTIAAGRKLSVSMLGNIGLDTISADAGSAVINGTLAISMNGGRGAGTLSAAAVDIVLGEAGRLEMTLSGDRDADTIGAAISVLGAGASSAVVVNLNGNAANDTLTLGFAGVMPATLMLTVDGGPGFDTCAVPAGLAPPQLVVLNCEA